MELLHEILTAIPNVGFPIAVCIYLLWYVNQQSENHKQEMQTLNKTIENNTLAIQKLTEDLTIRWELSENKL